MQELRTDRLFLRQWRAEDIEPYTRFFSDQDRSRYFGGLKNADDAWRHLALQVGHWHLNGFGYWAVEELGNRTFVGCVGLWRSLDWPELELGYWVDDRQQRRGFAEEAAAECISYARETLKSPSLVSYIDPANIPSQNLALKLGAKYEQTIELVEQGPHLVYRHF
ncbi:GNAT family N-acetyltransferase [Pelagibius sp. Alg239-R121]|uniref:GNAT family N-acetyltransferase n=1 Tax=Pelagibius sp. Alg239-R121 TaxID=2993448 RepID=UPI0024A78316|nr:GNAT family N-acetyltransferase [Pelagibius sp. Alg239-R121]